MLSNYLRVALRNFQRHSIFTLIHVLGLSIGLSSAIVILLLVRHEFSFDKFQRDAHRIYRVVARFKFEDMTGTNAAVPGPLSSAVSTEVSGIDATVPVMQFQGDASVMVSIPKRDQSAPVVINKQPNVVFTNDQYFELVGHPWLAGKRHAALITPFTVVLTRQRAAQYFPGLSPEAIIGREIIYDKDLITYVSGVVEDIHGNTDFTALEFISFPSIAQTTRQQDFMMDRWDDGMAYSKLYLKLSPANEKESVERQLTQLLRKNSPALFQEPDRWSKFELQPLEDIHFNASFASFDQRVANKSVLYGLIAIAGFLLLLGCINFVNLSTAQAALRAKEIGIRKTIGGLKKQLMSQFLVETLCVTTLATVVALGATPLLIQLFAEYLPPTLGFTLWTDPVAIACIPVLVLLVSFLSGFYPALILSGLQPIQVLRNRMKGGATRSGGIRRTLTVTQFVVAQFFIVAAFMVSKQIHFSINKELGYRKDAILTFDIPRDTSLLRVETLHNYILSIKGVEDVSIGFLPPAMEGAAFGNFAFDNGQEKVKVNSQVRWGMPNFLSFYAIPIIAGRNVSDSKNSNEAVVNEAYVKEMGIRDITLAVGESIIQGENSRLTIVGVMKDFHAGSSRMSIGPVVFKTGPGRTFHIALTTGSDGTRDWSSTIEQIEKDFKVIYPAEEFNYSFFDETIASFYRQEQSISWLLNWATALSIMISCLGLLGLVIYTSETRKKEVGIRKILGASVGRIVSLLSLEFIRLVLIASLIAAPLAWYVADQWLEGFAYRTTISWWVFAGSGVLLVCVAMITLSFQTIGTARRNPVDSLRSE